jgi:hypothetical protein
MKFIRTSKFVKAELEVFEKIQDALTPYFLKKLTSDDEDLKRALEEENYEEAVYIRDTYYGDARGIAESLTYDIAMEIDKMGIPYRFENIKANGIAVNGYTVIANRVLDFSPHILMYVIFHELAHHYQYKNYGHDFAESIYTNDIAHIEEDVERLIWIEDTADKFAQMKTNHYIRKYDLDFPLFQDAGKKDKKHLRFHVIRMKQMVMDLPPERRNINDINEALYNSIKMGE